MVKGPALQQIVPKWSDWRRLYMPSSTDLHAIRAHIPRPIRRATVLRARSFARRLARSARTAHTCAAGGIEGYLPRITLGYDNSRRPRVDPDFATSTGSIRALRCPRRRTPVRFYTPMREKSRGTADMTFPLSEANGACGTSQARSASARMTSSASQQCGRRPSGPLARITPRRAPHGVDDVRPWRTGSRL